MDAIFLRVLNMSLTASYVILFVLVARLLLRKAPKIFSYALWSVVLFRLVCPFSFESLFSLLFINVNPIPGDIMYAEVPQINTGIDLVDNAANPILSTQTAMQGASVNTMQIWVSTGRMIWLIGIAILLIYSVVSLLRLRSRLIGAVKWRDNIYLADHIASPFVMGVLRPKIYLPSTLLEREQKYIILHEQTHIRRLDHIIKIIAFLVLTVHWFNPLAWLAFILCVKDMEMSCDEGVMKQMGTDIRKEYSASLLSLAAGRRIIAGIPLAFGEGDTKSRIKNVLNYKKPTFWIIIVAVIAVIAIGIGLAANPREDVESIIKKEMADILSDNPGEFSIDGVERAGDYTLAVVNCKPGMGQGGIYLYVLGKEAGKLTVIDRIANDPPISLGVAVYKKTLPDTTVVYGAVSDQVWLNPDDAPRKVNFTEVKARYAEGLAQSVKVSNNHAFMICLDGNVFIEDVQFLSGNEVVSMLSDLPIGENVIEDFNSSSGDAGTNGADFDFEQYYKQYEQYGLTYDKEKDRLYYKGELVRYFDDTYPYTDDEIAGIRTFNENGTIDVYGVRDLTPIQNEDGTIDPGGTLLGLRAATQEEFDNLDTEQREVRLPPVRLAPSTGSLFASEDTVNEIKANLDENAEDFYESDVIFDFAHVVPVYYAMGIDKDNPPNTLLETLIFADRYILPVTDTQEEIIAIAELQEVDGKWTVGTSTEIDKDGLRNITDKIQEAQQSAQGNGSIYYTELPANNSVGLLVVSGNEEFFIHLDDYGPDEPQNVKDVLPGIIEEYTRNGDIDTDGGRY